MNTFNTNFVRLFTLRMPSMNWAVDGHSLRFAILAEKQENLKNIITLLGLVFNSRISEYENYPRWNVAAS